MDKNKRFEWVIWIIIILLAWALVYNVLDYKHNNNIKQPIEIVDTIYNRVKLDSIYYEIEIRDTTIYRIKEKIKEDEKEIMALPDSATVKLFFELVRE